MKYLNSIKFMIMTLALIFMASGVALAIMPPHPDTIKEWKAKGIYGKKMQELKEASERLMPIPNLEYGASEYGKYGREIAREGDLKGLVVLVEFPVAPALPHKDGSTVEYFEELLFSTGKQFGQRSSFRDFYLHNSRGKLDLTGSVVGWYRAKHELSYYTNWNYGTGPGSKTELLIDECLEYAAEQYGGDLSVFDNNNDKIMDLFLVVHAGVGGERKTHPDFRKDNFWSHFSSGYRNYVGGVSVKGYSINPEYSNSANDNDCGTMIHECGHWFGLPDLYDYDGDSAGIGVWGMMAAGSHYFSSFCAWSKVYYGWINEEDGTLVNVRNDIEQAEIIDINNNEDDSKIYRLWSYGQDNPEYFLVENRQKQDFGADHKLRGNGLLIWHVDETAPPGRPNDDQDRPLLKLMQCDGRDDLYYNRNNGDSSDLWPCANRNFTDYSNPSSRAYNGSSTLVSVENISASGAIMFADLKVGVLSEGIKLTSYEVNDIFGNADGVPNPCEEMYLKVKLVNNSGPKTNVVGKLTSDDEMITIHHDTVNFGDMDIGEVSSGDSSYHLLIICAELETSEEVISFSIEITADEYIQMEDFFLILRDPGSNVILRDDFEQDPEKRGWTSKEPNSGWLDEWDVSNEKNHTAGGRQSFKFGDRGNDGYRDKAYGILESPQFILPEKSKLTFHYWIDAEDYINREAYDGGLVKLFINGVDEFIEPVGQYPFEISLAVDNPLKYQDGDNITRGYPCYSGRYSWSKATFDLSQFEGQAQLQFYFASDDFTKPPQRTDFEGWYIDDIIITTEKEIKDSPPVITLAGYYDTNVSVAYGGTLNMKAFIHDPNGFDDITSVEVRYNGNRTGLDLTPDPDKAGLYVFSKQLPPLDSDIFSPGMQIPLTIVAIDRTGLESVPWPYFRVVDVETTDEASTTEQFNRQDDNPFKFDNQMPKYDPNYYYNQTAPVPNIKAVGYLDIKLNNYGGEFKFIAQFDETEADQIERVDVISGYGTLLSLYNDGTEGDFVPNDKFFTFTMQKSVDIVPGDYILYFEGVTKDGQKTISAPFLTLN